MQRMMCVASTQELIFRNLYLLLPPSLPPLLLVLLLVECLQSLAFQTTIQKIGTR